ncbi:MAG: NYN domain-containing protein [Bryobacterales bacterium]|nr:NYN domain-containing protein [Bryobacterales bacterium]
MQEKNIAVFVDYDNIEIGVKSTLSREFAVGVVLDALKERGQIVAKFAYANWSRQEGATRQMAENAVQMVQRIPSPRGDKNGADINLALDALEMAFTHSHVNAFAIVSGDSDFVPLVNKLKEYGKTVFIVGGKAFTSTILQQNCHEFVSYESLLDDRPAASSKGHHRDNKPFHKEQRDRDRDRDRDVKREPGGAEHKDRPPQQQQQQRQRPAPLDLSQAMPLVERALEVLERRSVQPQLGLLKSTMLQLSPAFNERAYGAHSFSEFVERMKAADYVKVTGSGGRYIIERKGGSVQEIPPAKPEDALPPLRDVLETHRLDMEEGVPAASLESWFIEEIEGFDLKKFGFQSFAEFLNFAQDRLVVRVEASEERGLMSYLGAEFYPPAPPPAPVRTEQEEEEDDGPQPIVRGQPSYLEPNAKPVSPRARKKRAPSAADGNKAPAPRKTAVRKRKPAE